MSSIGKRGKPIQGQSREIIYNVYKYFCAESVRFKKIDNVHVFNYFKKVQERVVTATGISRRTLNNLLNEVPDDAPSSSIKFRTPKKGRPKKQYRLNLDEFDYDIVRRTVYDFHLRLNELPTVSSLKAKLCEAINYKGSEKTLRVILHEMGFRFNTTEDNRKILMEKHDVSLKRIEYLDIITKFRGEGKNIIYVLDESYALTSKTDGKTANDDKKKGRRLVILHAGNEKGFVPGAMLLSTDTTAEHHKKMTNDNFKKWLVEQLIPNIPRRSVLVLDNAPCHNQYYVEKPPNANSTKETMLDWLDRQEIPVDPKLTKLQIYAVINQHKERLTDFSVDKILGEHGHIVVRLPPYHPDFNPIKNIWSQLKSFVASKDDNNDYAVTKLLTEKVNTIGVEDWKKVCEHTIKYENEYRKIQYDLDAYTDRVVIKTAYSDSEMEHDESTDSEMDEIDN